MLYMVSSCPARAQLGMGIVCLPVATRDTPDGD